MNREFSEKNLTIKGNLADIWRHINYPNLEHTTNYFYPIFTHLYSIDELIDGNFELHLQDGVLGIIGFLNSILKLNLKLNSTFILPAYLAPIIPKKLVSNFKFYAFSDKKENSHYDELFLVFPSTRSQMNLEICISLIKKNLTGIQRINIIHSLFDIEGVNSIFEDASTPEDLFQFKESLSKAFSNTRVKLCSFDEFKQKSNSKSLIIDSNSTCLLTNETTIIKMARLRNLSIEKLETQFNDFKIINRNKIRTDLELLSLSFNGNCILSNFEESLIGTFSCDNFISPTPKDLKFSKEIYEFAKHISINLQNFHFRKFA